MGRKKTKFVINLPKSWDDITLAKYQELVQLYDETDNKPSLQQLISVLSNQSVESVNKMPALIIEEIMNNLSFLKDTISDEISNKIEIDNDEYTINYLEDLKFGEFVDIQTVLKDDKHNYSTILAILCRKDNEEYNDEFIAKKVPDRIKLFEEQSIVKIYPTITFFLTLSQISKDNMNSYSVQIKEVINQKLTSIENLLTTGHGKKRSTKSQMIRLQKLRELVNNI